MSWDIATPYTASYVITRRDDKVVLTLRSNTDWMNHYYGLAAGKVEKNESFTQAAIREAKEEIGIDVKPEDLKHVLTIHRKSEDKYWVDVFFEVEKWEGEPYNAEPEVHSEIAWADPGNLPENTIPIIFFAFEQIKEGKTYSEYGWDLPKD